MSTMPNDPLAGMEEGALTLNADLAAQEAAIKPVEESDDDVVELTAEDEVPDDEERPKKNKVPRDERIKQLTSEKKTLQQQIEELKKGSLQTQIDDIKKLLTPSENSVNIPVNRDAEPDPTDLDKYRLGDLDPAYTRDLARYEVRSELAAAHQRQVQQEAQARQQQHASEVLGIVAAVSDKGASLHPDYVESVVQPFLRGEIPLEEHTFLAASEAEHGAEVLRELALNRNEAARVASLSPYQQTKYVADKSNEIAARNKPRLPGASAPPNSTARGTGGRFGIRGDEDDLDAVEKALFTRR
tara:strand:- start:899 stop:1798 length:900 start_codon:yes stop_codon:yes gene_type:complete